MRLFLALNIPADARRRSFEATTPLRVARPDVRWVPEGQLHLTLKFLGEQPEIVAQSQQTLEQCDCIVAPTDQRQAVCEPETAGEEGAFARRQSVGLRSGPITVD